MKHAFIISSALKTRFGSYDQDQRLLQTYRTLKSVYDRIPDAKVILVESSGEKVESETIQHLGTLVHCLIDYSGLEVVNKIYHSTPNWDIVKTVCEMVCYNLAYQRLEEMKFLDDVDRIHKLSGRYVLNDNFDRTVYEKYPDKIVVCEKVKTPFGDLVNIPYQYMSRLWSWPKELHPTVVNFYNKGLVELRERVSDGRFADIEHLMYMLLPQEHLQEVPTVGVEGYIGGNRKFVRD